MNTPPPQQLVHFAYARGFQVRHIESNQVATVKRQIVKTIARGKQEPMYVLELEDGSELRATQKELVVVVGGAHEERPRCNY